MHYIRLTHGGVVGRLLIPTAIDHAGAKAVDAYIAKPPTDAVFLPDDLAAPAAVVVPLPVTLSVPLPTFAPDED